MDGKSSGTHVQATGAVTPERKAQVAAMLSEIGIDIVVVHGTDEIVDWLGDLEQVESVAFVLDPASLAITMRPVHPAWQVETADVRATGDLVVVQVEHQPGRRDERRVRLAVSTVVHDWIDDTIASISIIPPTAA